MDDLLYVQFDHFTLVENNGIADKLAEFYCSIWMYDPNFKEYRQCPVCHKYYSFEDSQSGITSCYGSGSHAQTDLVDAWDPKDVKRDLLELTSDHSRFFGAVAVVPQTGRIVGFSWAKLMNASDVSRHWGPPVSTMLLQLGESDEFVYYNEIATDLNFRKRGIASRLCKMVCRWAKDNHPNKVTFLRTHASSPARILFEKMGYVYFAEDNEYGEGRIMMKVDRSRDLIV